MSEVRVLDATKLPEQAKRAIFTNITSGEGPWVVINLALTPPSVIPSDRLSADRWLDAIHALRAASEDI
jgi:predicted transcriptional regulator